MKPSHFQHSSTKQLHERLFKIYTVVPLNTRAVFKLRLKAFQKLKIGRHLQALKPQDAVAPFTCLLFLHLFLAVTGSEGQHHDETIWYQHDSKSP